ncbi:MAG: dockerin type I domain-containing protein, partial [Ruminococcus sp.]|nr:dockerin type I domain-containing protein [Ruminococcus sp.]
PARRGRKAAFDDDDDDECIQKEFKEAQKIIEQYKGKTIKQVADDIKSAPIKKNPLKGGELSAECNVMGALSASYDPEKGFAECVRSGGIVFRGQLLIQFEFKYEWDTTIVVASVPVAISVGVGLKLNVNTSFTIECNEGDLEVTGSLSVEAEVSGEVFAGVGVAGAIAAGVYGEVSITFFVTLLSVVPEDRGLNKITFEYEVGVKAYIGPFELKKSLLSPDDPIVLYSKRDKQQGKTASLGGMYSLIYDESLYTLDDTASGSVWTADKKTAIPSSSGYLSLTELASGALDTTQIQLASIGDKLVMVYLDSDPTRGAVNAYRLMYTVYTADKGWSVPAQLDSDKTGDYAPCLWTDGGKMYLIYQNTAAGLTDKAELTDWTAAQNIAVSEFDTKTGKFGTPTAITTDKNVLDKKPVITTADGKTYAVWVSNAENSYIGADNANSIMVSELGEAGWSAPEAVISNVSAITELTAASHNDQLYIVYVTDDDNDLNTKSDRTLRTVKYGEAQPYIIASGSVSAPVFAKAASDEESCLYWEQDDNICRSENLTNAEYLFYEGVPAVQAGFEIVGDRIIWAAADSGKTSNLYSSAYDSESGEWSEPVKLTEQGDYLRNVRAASFGDKIVTVMDRTSAAVSADDVATANSIVTLDISSITNIALTDVYYDKDDYEAGKPMPVDLTVENRGDSAVSGVHVTIAGEDGKAVFDKVLDCELPVNGAAHVKAEVTPDTAEELTISVNTADDGDTFADDSTYKLAAAFSVLEISAEKTDNNTLALTVTNNGTAAGSDDITVAELMTGRVLDTVSFKDIAAGKSATQNIDLTKYGVTTGGITLKGSGLSAEKVLYDAMSDVDITPTETKLGDVNGDGKVDAKDATMVLVYYSKMSTGEEGNLSDEQKKAADMNGDSLIDAKDASKILAIYAAASTGKASE